MNHGTFLCGESSSASFLRPPAGFPAYSVKHGIAVIELRARNGYIHRFRVDAADIPFLHLCWPFTVSAGGKRKKVIKWVGKQKIELHTVWLMHRHGLRSRWDFSRKPKCRNHDWLDWTQDNIYLPKVNHEAESRREAYMSNRLTGAAKEMLYARMCGQYHPIPSDDPEIVWAFQDAARMPSRSVRDTGCGADLDEKSDED
jgi:hypothetical protein